MTRCGMWEESLAVCGLPPADLAVHRLVLVAGAGAVLGWLLVAVRRLVLGWLLALLLALAELVHPVSTVREQSAGPPAEYGDRPVWAPPCSQFPYSP